MLNLCQPKKCESYVYRLNFDFRWSVIILAICYVAIIRKVIIYQIYSWSRTLSNWTNQNKNSQIFSLKIKFANWYQFFAEVNFYSKNPMLMVIRHCNLYYDRKVKYYTIKFEPPFKNLLNLKPRGDD